MTDLAKDAQERAAATSQEKAARKVTNGSKKKVVKPSALPPKANNQAAPIQPAPESKPLPVKVDTKPRKAKSNLAELAALAGIVEPTKSTTTEAEADVAPLTEAKPKGPFKAKDQKPLSLPKPLSGLTPVYMLFAAPRSTNVADNRRNESLNNMQNQLFLGVSLDRALLESAKARYTKDNPDLYFWISTKKALGEAPKNMRLALQHENLLVAHGMM